MGKKEIYSAAGLMAYIQEVGFLPLLDGGIRGFSAEEIVADDCRYVVFPDGGWDWPDGNCVYGKFFAGKAGFISCDWWPDFCNYRRSKHPVPAEGSIDETVLLTLQSQGPLITRELRAACGFNGPKMRSRFDGYVTRLQMGCYIVTQDFVYPTDKHGKEYGWGWSLLTTPEALLGRESCTSPHTPQESYDLLANHFRKLLPEATDKQIQKLLG